MEGESKTRADRIDPKLTASGWSVVPFARQTGQNAVAVEEYPTDLGPADYVLVNRGQPCGVVEAKKLTLGPQGVLSQAQRYSRVIRTDDRWQGEFGVPFLYSTNGEQIWFQDVRQDLNRSRKVASFHT